MASGKGLIHGKQIRDNSIGIEKLNFDITGGSGGAFQYNGDYELSVTASITGDNQSTGLSPSADPLDNSAFYVHVNGVVINLGDGVTTKPAYFSDDFGSNAVQIKNIGTQSVLYWNASLAKYILSPSDRITFEYEIGVTASNPIIDPFIYVHTQSLSSAVWNITHNLDGYPNVTSVDNSDIQIEGEVKYINLNEITITFNSSVSGKAYLS